MDCLGRLALSNNPTESSPGGLNQGSKGATHFQCFWKSICHLENTDGDNPTIVLSIVELRPAGIRQCISSPSPYVWNEVPPQHVNVRCWIHCYSVVVLVFKEVRAKDPVPPNCAPNRCFLNTQGSLLIVVLLLRANISEILPLHMTSQMKVHFIAEKNKAQEIRVVLYSSKCFPCKF